MLSISDIILPHVLLWNPLIQFRSVIQNLHCPHERCCHYVSGDHALIWNTGEHAGHCPRLLHDLNHVVLLVSVIYNCPVGHQLIGTDPRILSHIPEQEFIPFILFHKYGVMRAFARWIIAQTVQGISLRSTELLIKSLRNQYIESLQMQLECTLPFIRCEGQTSIKESESVSYKYLPIPSNDILHDCFVNNFIENHKLYFESMASLEVDSISVDHTFKVTANVGYLRADGKLITQYDSLFIVLNSKGQVVAWQFTKTSSIDECHDLLTNLKARFQSSEELHEVFVDNCCNIRNKLESILGENIQVKLDIFHATQ